MHPLLLPIALIWLASWRKRSPGGPKPTPPPGGTSPEITAQPIRSDPYAPLTAAKTDVAQPIQDTSSRDQAVIDATVAQVVTEPKRAAAQKLLQFLISTQRFGTRKDRPIEVKRAQRALGVAPDGIVGPATRKAAMDAGVALPPSGE